MRKTMKLIDLFNKMANGEKLPKKIMFCFRTFEYNGIDDYICIDENDYLKGDYCNGYSIYKWIFGNCLNDEIEILEEEKKLPKKIRDDNAIWEEQARDIDYDFKNTINQLIDYLEAKEKGE